MGEYTSGYRTYRLVGSGLWWYEILSLRATDIWPVCGSIVRCDSTICTQMHQRQHHESNVHAVAREKAQHHT